MRFKAVADPACRLSSSYAENDRRQRIEILKEKVFKSPMKEHGNSGHRLTYIQGQCLFNHAGTVQIAQQNQDMSAEMIFDELDKVFKMQVEDFSSRKPNCLLREVPH